MKSNIRKLTGAILIALAPMASYAATTATEVEMETTRLDSTAQNKGQTQVATRIASSFATLAGSQANALQLVRALRNGTEVTLTSPATGTGSGTGTGTGSGTGTGTGAGTGTGTGTGTGSGTGPSTTTTTFTPPTGKMGWGNVFISLALAQDTLTRAGITKPTAAQLQAALVGGDVTGADGKTVTLKGVLTMRAEGMGWGQIAQASGTKLGPVVSAIKSAHGKVAALPPTTTAPTTAGSTPKSAAKGITTAAGTNGSSSSGKHESKGLVTAAGTPAGGVSSGDAGSKGHSYGKGIVTGAGGAATVAATPGTGHSSGAGVVNANGAGAAGGVTTGNGGNGQGKANGKGKGPG